MTRYRIVIPFLPVLASMTMCTDGYEQQSHVFTDSSPFIATNNVATTEQTTEVGTNTITTKQSTVTTEVMSSTFPENFNETCQEGPEAGNPPANQTCDCGQQNYFYGNYCQNVNLDDADDINTSKRVMEIRWNVFPNFTRGYSFVYRESDSNGAPLRQSVDVKEASGYFYAWLTYLKSGEVRYVVCVLEKTAATEIIEKEDNWPRLDDDNQDCVTIQTEVSVTQEMTMAAILIGAGMGIILIVIFTANLCVSRQKKVQGADDEFRVEQTMVLTQNMNTPHEYIDMHDKIHYILPSSSMQYQE